MKTQSHDAIAFISVTSTQIELIKVKGIPPDVTIY